jgi:hypothetical protein
MQPVCGYAVIFSELLSRPASIGGKAASEAARFRPLLENTREKRASP